MKRAFVWLLTLLSVISRLSGESTAPTLPDGIYAEVTTPRGVVLGELHFQKVPLTVMNFVGLAEGTLGPLPRKPFFDGLPFHRIVPDFVAQGGDPTGTGDGGPGYSFPDEFVPGLRHDSVGVMQMANDGPDTNGSQWCFMLREMPRLNYLHTVFGQVVSGLEVLPQIRQGDTMRVKILRIGTAANAFKADEATFAKLSAKAKRYTGSMEPGSTAHFDDPDKLLPTDPARAKHFNFKLANFERATGRKLIARVLARVPAGVENGQIGQYLKEQAQLLGVAKEGALAIYFADRNEWRLWVGEASVSAFRKGAKRDDVSVNQSELHDAKQTFFAEARTKADAAMAYAVQRAPANAAVPENQKLKLWTDAVLDGLIFKFEP